MLPEQSSAPTKSSALLGAGVGEVYRAQDSKLAGEVGIKVLPAAVTQDSKRLARFEREAKVLASLNHPNIAPISSRAKTMDAVRDYFYRGEAARGIDAFSKATAGLLRYEDMAASHVEP